MIKAFPVDITRQSCRRRDAGVVTWPERDMLCFVYLFVSRTLAMTAFSESGSGTPGTRGMR